MKKLLALFFISSTFFIHSDSSLTPLTPVQVAVDANSPVRSCTPVAVSNRQGDIFVVWTDSTNGVFGSWSYDKGVTWSPAPISIPVGPNGSGSYPFLTSNNTGFVFTFVDSGTSVPSSIFYNSSSGTWGPELSIDATITNATDPLFVTTTPQGFLATFLDQSGNGYANLSPDGTTWQTPSQVVFSSSAGYTVTSISGCGNASLLLTSWIDAEAQNVYVSTSTNGTNWSTPTVVANYPGGGIVMLDPGSSACFANSQGFLVVYFDNSGNLWSIFSEDGTHWPASSNLIVSTNAFPFAHQTPQISGNNSGFVTTWLDDTSTGYASFSKDGKNWEAPVQLSSPGAFPSFNFNYIFAAASVYKDLCLFSWSDGGGNIFVCTSSFPFSSTPIQEKKWGFTSPVLLNRPSRQF